VFLRHCSIKLLKILEIKKRALRPFYIILEKLFAVNRYNKSSALYERVVIKVAIACGEGGPQIRWQYTNAEVDFPGFARAVFQ